MKAVIKGIIQITAPALKRTPGVGGENKTGGLPFHKPGMRRVRSRKDLLDHLFSGPAGG